MNRSTEEQTGSPMPPPVDPAQAIQDELNRLRLMVDGSKDYISLIDRTYVYRAVNRAYSDARKVDAREMIGKSVRMIWGTRTFNSVIKYHLDRCFAGEIVQHRASFNFREAERSFMDVTYYPCRNSNGEITHAVVVNHDISELVRKEEELRKLAYFDPLTSLSNRARFRERLALQLAYVKRSRESLAVFFFDIDNFKNINDIHGHAVGDALLREVAARLRGAFRKTDTIDQPASWYQQKEMTICRLGGDEFTLVFPGVKEVRSLSILADRLKRLFSKPFFAANAALNITCSVGISVFPDDGHDGETLVKHADLAMYRAKESGKNQHAFYNPTMSEQLQATTAIENRLPDAIKSGAFEMYFQPKIDTATNSIVGCEALARWKDPQLGEIPPARFIPIAEKSGLIQELDLAVLEQACRKTRKLHQMGFTPGLSVNYSNIHFRQQDIVERTLEILKRVGFPGESLEIEITESAMTDDIDGTVAKLKRLRAQGIRIALDDFGTGFSSLTYLTRLPIDVIKLDRTFTTQLDHQAEFAVFEGIMTVASKLGLTVVAEGIENAAQLDLVQSVGQPLIQGYFFSKPLPYEDLVTYLAEFGSGGGEESGQKV